MEVLLTIPAAELHRVVASTQSLVAQGDFTIRTSAVDAKDPRVEAAVGNAAPWPLGRHLPCLKVGVSVACAMQVS